MDTAPTLTWTKLVLIGMPGTECGYWLKEGGESEPSDFLDEFGPCSNDSRWLAGMLFLCQEHAAMVAKEFGDDIADIEAAWLEGLAG